jgi:hypothetical protein
MSVPMFSLTELTGREASAQRSVVIGTVEMNWRVWMVLVWTFPLALIITAIGFAIVGSVAIVLIPVVEAFALYMIHFRTRSGLKLRRYQALWDRKKSAVNQFFVCGQPIDLSQSKWTTLASASVENPLYRPHPDVPTPTSAPATTSRDDLFVS